MGNIPHPERSSIPPSGWGNLEHSYLFIKRRPKRLVEGETRRGKINKMAETSCLSIGTGQRPSKA